MALILPNQLLVLNAYALLVDETPGNTAYAEHQAYISANGTSAYASALDDIFAGSSNASLASTMRANLGLGSVFTQAEAEAYLAANSSNRVGAMLDLATMLVNYSGTDAALVAAKTAYVSTLDNSYAYSSDPANKSGASLDGDTATTTFSLTAGTDRVIGTAAADFFEAFLSQNSTAGGVSNTLSSADTINGGAGVDTLYAEIVPEFFGTTGDRQIDIQPDTTSVEIVEFEAREFGSNDNSTSTVSVDAKWMSGVEKIGSSFSDSDLVIENLTTLTDAGVARNTDAITVTMDHTDNFNSDEDASDLHVHFDDDYLLAGQTAEAQAFFFLLDEAAELAGNPNRLDRIDVDGLRFSLDGGATIIELQDAAAQAAGTHQGFVNALQDELAALIAAGTVSAGTTLTLDPSITDVTGLDDGSLSDPIPAIVLNIGDGTTVTPIGFSRVEELIGQYDVYGQFNADAQVTDEPITVNIDLDKVGRNGEGGDLVIGGKEQNNDNDNLQTSDGPLGITVFRVDVLGTEDRPSNLGMLTSTNGQLESVFISTEAAYVAGGSYASLTIRDGFGARFENSVLTSTNNDLKLVNADSFRGNLSLGEETEVINLDTLTAQGGGDVFFHGLLTGAEENQAYSYSTGAGDDTVIVDIDGDATDFAKSSVNVATGAGADEVEISTFIMSSQDVDPQTNQILNQVILKNITVDTGADNDTVTLNAGSEGDAFINTGSGNDVIYTDGGGTKAVWAFNYDDARTTATGGLPFTPTANLPGVQTSLAYLAGATVRVTLSGAGIAAAADGGGVMALGVAGANQFNDGYESSVTIGSLVNGNSFFGDQRDINAAIMKAINDDAVLNKLIKASISTNNTLVVTSLTGGEFNTADLEVTFAQAAAGTSARASAVLTEAETLFHNSSLTLTDLWGSATPTGAELYLGLDNGAGALDSTTSQAGLTAYYTGLGVNNATIHHTGAASTNETDNIINAGTGNDVIVLSTDATENAPVNFTLSDNNALLNGASNETLVMIGNIGADTVMNFTADSTAAGIDFLDYTSYLTSKTSPSGSVASTVEIAVTLDAAAIAAAIVVANEVTLLQFDNTAEANETFAGLSASVVASLFNDQTGTTAVDYGNFLDGSFSAAVDIDDAVPAPVLLVNGAAKSIVMVENHDNLGLYKVFELSWYAGSSNAASTHDVTVTELGSLDFGTSLTGLAAVNLVGSAAYDTLLNTGLYVPV